MLCFAVVVTYNGSRWIDKCFNSLINSTVPIKILAVDNGSNDGTPEFTRQYFPGVDIIETYQNLGFGKANNIGIKRAYKAGADYIFLVNQDAWVEPDTVEKLMNIAERHPEYGILSPVHLNGNGSAFDYGFLNYLCRNKMREYLSELYLKPKDELAEIYQLEFVNAAFWLLPRKTIEIVGGFNPFFFHYGEDYDYVNRCDYFNLRTGFVPSAKAYHDRVQHDSETKKKLLVHVPTLIKLFDPQELITVDVHIKALEKSLVRSLICFQIWQVKQFVTELGYYFSNRRKILEISTKLKSPGLTFLD
jgi:N-acetylglucosaminyl-diphospho-decaprenol L-rhamnosyltransferase